jgi:hypothetical protein
MNENQLEVRIGLETCGNGIKEDLKRVKMEFIREGLNDTIDEIFLGNYVFGICDLFKKKS